MLRSRRANAIIAVLGGRPIAYHPALAIALNKLNSRCGAKEAIWISQMLYWDGKGADPDNWIYKTREEWTAETGLSRYEQETVRKHLVKLGILEEKLAGMPARLHYRLNFDRLAEVAELAYPDDSLLGGNPPTRWRDFPQQDRGKSPSMLAENPPRSEITQRQHNGGDGGSRVADSDALKALLGIDVTADQAHNLASTRDRDQVLRWVACAKEATGLTNPAGLVVRRLLDNVPAPPMPDEFEPEPYHYEPPLALPIDDDPPGFTVPGTDLDARDVWSRVLEELRMQMTRATFDTWLGGSRIVRADDELLVVQVRDEYAVEWLRTRWMTPIKRTLTGILGTQTVEIEFVTDQAADE